MNPDLHPERPLYYPPKWTQPMNAILNPKRLKVGDRDKWICQLCKQPIEYLYLATIDHIIPKSKGGTERMSNLQIVHQKCNSAKGSSLEKHPPEYYRSYVSIAKKRRKIKNEVTKKSIESGTPKTNRDDFKGSQVTELWNELAKNRFTNLSYNKFESYFEKYCAVRIQKLSLIPKGDVLNNILETLPKHFVIENKWDDIQFKPTKRAFVSLEELKTILS